MAKGILLIRHGTAQAAMIRRAVTPNAAKDEAIHDDCQWQSRNRTVCVLQIAV